MAGEVLVDCLPYIDQGYEEAGVKEAVLSMVEEETRRYRPTKNYLEHIPPLNVHNFETEVMKAEFDRLQNCQPMEPFNMKRYELPQPQKKDDDKAWLECVNNSMAQLDHQSTRITNLELMLKFGGELWKIHNQNLVVMLQMAQKQAQGLRQLIQETNWQRKSSQTSAGDKLKHLEASWVGLVSKNYEIERVCAELEENVSKLEAELNVPPPPQPPAEDVEVLEDEEEKEEAMEEEEEEEEEEAEPEPSSTTTSVEPPEE